MSQVVSVIKVWLEIDLYDKFSSCAPGEGQIHI